MYCIDLLEFENSEIKIMGWAYSMHHSSPVCLNFYNKLGTLIESKPMNVNRPDVLINFNEVEINVICGFDYDLNISLKDIGKIEFCDELGNKDTVDALTLWSYLDTGAIRNIEKLFLCIRLIKKLLGYIVRNKKLPIHGSYFRQSYLELKLKYRKKTDLHYSYSDWIRNHTLTTLEMEKQKSFNFNQMPLISLVTVISDCHEVNYYSRTIKSVLNQTYSNWELKVGYCGNDLSQMDTLKALEKQDCRIALNIFQHDTSNSDVLNKICLNMSGDYLGIMHIGDTIAPDALYEIVSTVNNSEAVDLIYSDEDYIHYQTRERMDPWFKPDWSPDTLRSFNYISNFAVFRRDLFIQAGSFNKRYNGVHQYELYLRLTEKARKIEHIPKVLYHSQKSIQENDENAKVKNLTIMAIDEHLQRINLSGKACIYDNTCTYRIKYVLREEPLVSIIIPNKDHINDLRKCIDLVFSRSTYTKYEIIIIENNSTSQEIFEYYKEVVEDKRVRVLTWKKGFNYSAINNFGVENALGEYIIFLNNDVEVISSSWIEDMLMFAQREDVGVVGSKLYYEDNTIQHAGVIIGMLGLAAHIFKGEKRDSLGYYNRLVTVQNMSAVTAACMMMRKQLFQEIEGFDERLIVAFNDIDLCLKARQKGKLVIYNPSVELYHYESKSRGYEDTPEKILRFQNEVNYFRQKWDKVLEIGDPYYNKKFIFGDGKSGMEEVNIRMKGVNDNELKAVWKTKPLFVRE